MIWIFIMIVGGGIFLAGICGMALARCFFGGESGDYERNQQER